MKDQLIKLHEEFVDKGMPPSNINTIFLLKNALRIHDRNIGYVFLDMQTWLREEHGFYVNVFFKPFLNYFYCNISLHNTKSIIVNKYKDKVSPEFKFYNEALFSGLQEAIKLIE